MFPWCLHGPIVAFKKAPLSPAQSYSFVWPCSRFGPFSYLPHRCRAAAFIELRQGHTRMILSVSLLASGSFRRLLVLRLQCFYNSLAVTQVAEKVSSPRDEVFPFTSRYLRVTDVTVGTFCLRVGLHFGFSFLSGHLTFLTVSLARTGET